MNFFAQTHTALHERSSLHEADLERLRRDASTGDVEAIALLFRASLRQGDDSVYELVDPLTQLYASNRDPRLLELLLPMFGDYPFESPEHYDYIGEYNYLEQRYFGYIAQRADPAHWMRIPWEGLPAMRRALATFTPKGREDLPFERKEARSQALDFGEMNPLDQEFLLWAHRYSDIRAMRLGRFDGGRPRGIILGNEVLPLLAAMTSLEELSLGHHQEISDLPALAGLVNLEELHIQGTGVRDLSPLVNMRKLSYLDISFTHVGDLSPLRSMRSLKTLHFVTDNAAMEAEARSLEAAIPGLRVFTF